MKAMPQKYLEVVMPLVDKAREILESGEPLQPFAFVGNFETGRILAVLIDTRDDRSKDGSAEAIRLAAQQTKADFVFTIIEAWGLPRDKLQRHGEIVEKYGSVGASPYRIDTASFVLETASGIWLAQVPIKPKGYSRKKRTFGTVAFACGDRIEGRFTGLLGNRTGTGPLH